jgi:uncharacterized cysteine cluster protein YcgN (CxxCxxCC family)
MAEIQPWWENKLLTEMSREEWEQICDHCAKCCLHKLEDEDDGTVYYTDVACSLLDSGSCQCTDYQNRRTLVPDCLQLTPENLDQIQWMPPSCSYRVLKEGRQLADWHHLLSGDKNTIHESEKSIKGKYIDETQVDDLQEHVVEWPLE